MVTLKSSRLSCNWVVSFPPASMFNKTSKYGAEVDDSVVPLISSSVGYMESTYEWNWSLLIDKTSSMYLNVELKATARGLFSCRSFWMNSASKEYKNKSAYKGAQLVPMGIPTVCWKILLPKATKMLSMRNPNISLMSTSEYFCVESESWITKYVREWLATMSISFYHFCYKSNCRWCWEV
jgi:hypothetical protein